MILLSELIKPKLKLKMEYHNEIITIASLLEDVANHRKLQLKTKQLQITEENRKRECDLETENDNYLLTTKEASKLLGCSKATLWSYARQGILKPWQRKKRGLTRWLKSELKKL